MYVANTNEGLGGWFTSDSHEALQLLVGKIVSAVQELRAKFKSHTFPPEQAATATDLATRIDAIAQNVTAYMEPWAKKDTTFWETLSTLGLKDLTKAYEVNQAVPILYKLMQEEYGKLTKVAAEFTALTKVRTTITKWTDPTEASWKTLVTWGLMGAGAYFAANLGLQLYRSWKAKRP